MGREEGEDKTGNTPFLQAGFPATAHMLVSAWKSLLGRRPRKRWTLYTPSPLVLELKSSI